MIPETPPSGTTGLSTASTSSTPSTKQASRADREAFYHLTGQLIDQLRFLSESGCPGYDPPPEVLETLKRWEQGPVSPPKKSDRPENLDDIQRELTDCRRCALCKDRSRLVFGRGNPRARLVFVGEAPGYEEDRQGEPFVGEAGQMLTRIIKAMGETRESVYICNIVKCRPPGNRTPESAEIAACLPFLNRQLDAIQPAFICALGGVAAQALLNTEAKISDLRGRFHDRGGIRVMPTFHPAFLLRHPERKREVWEDMKQIMAAMAQKSD
jgi:DNA polymerase